jgi:vacuolar protein-sorting-associated protein 4
VKRAVEADHNCQYDKASTLYIQSVELFLLAEKWEKNARSKEMIKKKAGEYLDRAEVIDRYLRGERSTARAPASKAYEADTLGGVKDSDREFLDRSKPTVEWDDIAGHGEAKETLFEAAELPLLRPSLFTGIRQHVTRILLYGPPGTGKDLWQRLWHGGRSEALLRQTIPIYAPKKSRSSQVSRPIWLMVLTFIFVSAVD